jgi:hypothetical protein
MSPGQYYLHNKIELCWPLFGSLSIVTMCLYCEQLADTAPWHSTLTQHADTARWHSSLTQHADTARWHSTLTQHADTARWHSSLTQLADTARWHSSLTQLADTARWHSSLLEWERAAVLGQFRYLFHLYIFRFGFKVRRVRLSPCSVCHNMNTACHPRLSGISWTDFIALCPLLTGFLT